MTEVYEEVSRHHEGQKKPRFHGNHNHHRHHRSQNSVPGSPAAEGSVNQQPQLSQEEALAAISPLQLFSSYLLGVTENDRFKLVSIGEIARRYNTTPAIIDYLLNTYHLTKDDLQKVKDFDLSLARLDVQVAPAGISRQQIARQIFEEFSLG